MTGAHKRKVMAVAISFCMLATLGGCGKKQADSRIKEVKALESYGEIVAVSREEGSGTREVFTDKVGLKKTQKNGQEIDTTRTDAEIATDAAMVIAKVAENKQAIGYVSLGTLQSEECRGVKVLEVDGVKAEKSALQEGNYPLLRDFLLAYMGELSAPEQDFMKYILSAGQDVVNKKYIGAKKVTSLLSDQSAGKIRLDGSTSVAPLLQELAEEYKKINSHVEITIEKSDSTSGLLSAIQSGCDIGMSSRQLKEYEKELLEYKVIARDGVAVIVNEKNPVESLTTEQLREIFDGTDNSWADVNELKK